MHYKVLSGRIIIIFQEVKGLTKLYAHALARMKTCLNPKFQVPNCYGYCVTLLHEEEDEDEDEEDEEFVKIMFYLYFIPGVIFSFSFLHVLHLKRQIEIETESEN